MQAYKTILKAAASPDNAAKPYAAILTHLSSPSTPPTPVLLHCSAGKDRTGVICALILSLCGVSDDVVAHECKWPCCAALDASVPWEIRDCMTDFAPDSLTDLGLKSRHPDFLEQLMKEPALRKNPEGAKRMISSR